MKKIIDIQTKEEIVFDQANLPMMIHGAERSGASLFSIAAVAGLHKKGSKLLIYTAYPKGKDEFMSQIIDVHTMYYLEHEKDIPHAVEFQTIFVQSGNIDLLLSLISNQPVSDRVLFIKNIDTIKIPLATTIQPFQFILSGDFGVHVEQEYFKDLKFKTKICFTPLAGVQLPALEKYQAVMKSADTEKIVSLAL